MGKKLFAGKILQRTLAHAGVACANNLDYAATLVLLIRLQSKPRASMNVSGSQPSLRAMVLKLTPKGTGSTSRVRKAKSDATAFPGEGFDKKPLGFQALDMCSWCEGMKGFVLHPCKPSNLIWRRA